VNISREAFGSPDTAQTMVHVQSEVSNGNLVTLSHNNLKLFASLTAYNESFIGIVKKLHFKWNRIATRWQRSIDEYSGPITDRLLETASRLLSDGFDVYMPEALVPRLKAGDWRHEQKRWIIPVATDQFGIKWSYQDESLYLKAKLLPSAQWNKTKKAITIQKIYYAEVEGFAEEHGFEFNSDARSQLDNIRREYRKIVLPAIPMPDKSTTKAKKAYQSDPHLFMDIPEHHLQTSTSLSPYQQKAVDKLSALRVGGLFMEMGLGKTRCAIELVVKRQQRIRRVVWFCPVGLKLTVAAEIEKHTTGERVYIFDDKTDISTMPKDAFWYIVGIETISSSDTKTLAANHLIDADTFVIVDEASYIKGHSSLRTMRITEMSKIARYRLILTGTPISQGYEDLFSQMAFLSTDILGYSSFYTFANNHLEYSIEHPGIITRAHNVSQITSRIEPYTYQVSKADCVDLPDKIYDSIYCSLTDQQWKLYEETKSELLVEGEVDTYTLFLLFTRLQQIVSGYTLNGDVISEIAENRSQTLCELVARIPQDEKIIVWCKYVYSIEKIAKLLPESALYYGELNTKKRSQSLEKFRSSSCNILIATQATGGHGLTLNESRYHIFYENEFKYANRIQAEDRSHRIGQDKNVTYIDIVSNSGIDKRIQQALRKKQNVVQEFKREMKRSKEKASIKL
jgi:SNF2 family DNA or RNA helicase